MILVDSCVIIDIVENDPVWRPWSERQLITHSLTNELFVNAVVYAELSPHFTVAGEVDRLLTVSGLRFVGIPREAAFLAGKAHAHYRKRGGMRTSVLPDFFIGAHATVLGCPILTRDTRRYSTYFPKVPLIAP